MEQRIKDRAYQLWKNDGEQQGKDHYYWEEAERQIKQEDSSVIYEAERQIKQEDSSVIYDESGSIMGWAEEARAALSLKDDKNPINDAIDELDILENDHWLRSVGSCCGKFEVPKEKEEDWSKSLAWGISFIFIFLLVAIIVWRAIHLYNNFNR